MFKRLDAFFIGAGFQTGVKKRFQSPTEFLKVQNVLRFSPLREIKKLCAFESKNVQKVQCVQCVQKVGCIFCFRIFQYYDIKNSLPILGEGLGMGASKSQSENERESVK